MKDLEVLSNERLLIAGKTGSGKTFFARYLTRGLNRLCVLDSKGSLYDWGLMSIEDYPKEWRSFLAGGPGRFRVPPPRHVAQDEFYNGIFDKLYESGNVTLYIDELYAVVPPGARISPELNALYTRGREFGIGVYSSTQRPVFIPLVALSEAEVYVVFRLQLGDDRKRCAEFMGPKVLQTIQQLHGFYYYRTEWEGPEYNPGLVISHKPQYRQMEVVKNGV